MAKKPLKPIYTETQTLKCRGCSEPVKNVAMDTVAVLCWKCSTKPIDKYNPKKEDNGS